MGAACVHVKCSGLDGQHNMCARSGLCCGLRCAARVRSSHGVRSRGHRWRACVAPAHGTCALERGTAWRSAGRCAIWVPDRSQKSFSSFRASSAEQAASSDGVRCKRNHLISFPGSLADCLWRITTVSLALTIFRCSLGDSLPSSAGDCISLFCSLSGSCDPSCADVAAQYSCAVRNACYAIRDTRYAIRDTRYALRVTRYALRVTRYALLPTV